MNHRDDHTHKCIGCGVPVLCFGSTSANVDGWPPVMCSAVHLPNGEVVEVRCEACAELVDRCDEEAVA
jgi:hypothetical protein